MLDDYTQHPGHARGKASELMAAARLIQLGHTVALPIIDDDGVDLVIDYKIPAQVKSCAKTVTNCYRFMHFAGLRAEIYICHGAETDGWWVIPRDALIDVGIQANGDKRNAISISADQRYLNTKYAALSAYKDAWHLLGWSEAA